MRHSWGPLGALSGPSYGRSWPCWGHIGGHRSKEKGGSSSPFIGGRGFSHVALLGRSCVALGCSWGRLDPPWTPHGALVGDPGTILRQPWNHLWDPLGHLGCPPTQPINVQRQLHILGAPLGPLLGASRGQFGPSWSPPGPSWELPRLPHRCVTAVAHLGAPSWAPSWARLGAISGSLGGLWALLGALPPYP